MPLGIEQGLLHCNGLTCYGCCSHTQPGTMLLIFSAPDTSLNAAGLLLACQLLKVADAAVASGFMLEGLCHLTMAKAPRLAKGDFRPAECQRIAPEVTGASGMVSCLRLPFCNLVLGLHARGVTSQQLMEGTEITSNFMSPALMFKGRQVLCIGTACLDRVSCHAHSCFPIWSFS